GRLADQVGGESLLVRGTGLGTAAAGTAGVASMLNIGNLQLIGGGTGDGSTTLGIRPDAIGDSSATGTGTGFLTYSSGIGFRPLTNAELAPGIYRTVATNANIGVSTSQVFGNLTTNSLTFSSGGGLTAISNASQLTMGSSGFLTVNAAGGFTGGLLNTGGNQLIIHQVDSVNALDFSGYIQTTNQIVKAGAGTLNILKPQYFINNNFVVNAGTVNLNSGVDNTIPVIVGADRPSTTSLIMNQGTLDLKGKNQAFNVISATNTVPGSGGTITNTGANATLTSAGGGTFGGVISGNINLVRSGNNTSTFTSASTYNGSTTIRGGVLVLQDQGQLSTNDVVANFATLPLSDQGRNVIANRIPASTNIALTGTTLNYNGAQSAASLATSGGAMLTITGQNTITTAAMTGTVLPTTLTIGTLKRLAGTGGAVNFTGTGPNANLGQVGVGTPQTFITQINDGTTNTATTAVVTANNGILGGWATVAGTDFAGYVASGAARGGVGALGTAGFPAYSTAALSAGSATDNITVAASVTVPASTPVAGLGRTINSLRVSAASTITITTGEILTLGTGGLLLNGAASSITGGSLSAGASANTAAELFAYTNNTATISSVIANNGTGALTLVKNGPSSLTLSSNNTFTGGTIVNSGTLILGGNAGVTTVPAGSGAGATVGLTINNASVTMGTNSGQIAAATNININGAGLLTYTGNNTLSGILNFNNSGGFNGTAVATPAALTNSTTVNTSNLVTVTSTVGLAVGQVVTGANIPGGATIISILSPTQFLLSANATGGATNTTITLVNNAPTLIASSTAAGTLTITGAVNSNNDNLASVPTIAGPISLGNGNRTITTTGTSPQGLIISGVVSGAGATNVITKMGTSGLTLGGTSTFGILGSTSVNLNQGSLIYTADSAPSVVGTTTLTTSPLGLGTLLVSGDGTKLMGAGPTPIGTTTLRTLANPISITNPSNTLTFGASLVNTTMNGVITFTGSSGTVDVESPNNIITFGASLPSATTSFTKKGLGRLDLLLANNFNTAVNITDGTLSISNQYSLGGSVLNPGPAVAMAGGAYNLTATLANTFVQNPVSLTGNAIISAQIGTAAVGPVTLASTATALGVQGANANNIIGALTLNGSTQTTLFTATSSDLRVYGGLAGTTPSLRKTGPATLSLGGGSSYTGPVTVEQGILESLVGNANAITSGAATVNPGAVLRLAAPNNVGGTITLNTDSFGIAILGLGYNGALPAGVSFGVGGGTIAVDAFGFATALTTPMAGTNLYLGSSSTGNYIASSLGVGVGGAYRLGTGGGTLNMNTQVLTGAGNAVTIGSVTGTPGANLVGSGGTVVLNTPNSYGGGTTINGNGVAQIGMAGAFGNGTIHFNGGTLQPNSTGISTLLAPFDVTNNIDFTSSVVGAAGNASGAYAADAFFASGPTNSSHLKLSGNVNLGNVSQRLIAATSTTSIVEMTGVVSGAAAFSKVGAGILKLTNTGNSYSGGTNLYQGTLLLQADNILPAGAVNFAGGVYGVWDTSYTTNRDFSLSGMAPIFGIAGTTVTTPTGTPSLPIGGAFDVGAVQVFTQSASSVISGVGSLIKTGAGTMVLNGTNTYGPTIASNALQTILTAGVLSISNDANLGNITPLTINGTTVAPGGISFNGGQLLVTDDIITNRTLTMTGTGSINVAAGKTFAVYGTIPDSGNSLAINGPGTVIFNGGAVNGSATNAHNATSINNGGTLMTQATAGTPFGDTAVTINGGTLRINTNGPAATMTLATVTYAAGSYIRLDAMAGFDTQFTATALTRSAQGTLTIIPAATGSMGNTPLSDSRLLTTTVLGQDTRT
ncbi:MAG: transporter, partial [Verrucomicrobiaceae bacterium]|nr:transporter [Verrucomicrobiaceae bacterium]